MGIVKGTLQSFADQRIGLRVTLSKPPQASSARPFAASSEEYCFFCLEQFYLYLLLSFYLLIFEKVGLKFYSCHLVWKENCVKPNAKLTQQYLSSLRRPLLANWTSVWSPQWSDPPPSWPLSALGYSWYESGIWVCVFPFLVSTGNIHFGLEIPPPGPPNLLPVHWRVALVLLIVFLH